MLQKPIMFSHQITSNHTPFWSSSSRADSDHQFWTWRSKADLSHSFLNWYRERGDGEGMCANPESMAWLNFRIAFSSIDPSNTQILLDRSDWEKSWRILRWKSCLVAFQFKVLGLDRTKWSMGGMNGAISFRCILFSSIAHIGRAQIKKISFEDTSFNRAARSDDRECVMVLWRTWRVKLFDGRLSILDSLTDR